MGSSVLWLTGLAVLFLCLLVAEKDLKTSNITFKDAVKQNLFQELGQSVYDRFLPVISYIQEEDSSKWLWEEQLSCIMPLYGYTLETEKKERMQEEPLLLSDILLAESQEGFSESAVEAEQDTSLQQSTLPQVTEETQANVSTEIMQGTTEEMPTQTETASENTAANQQVTGYEEDAGITLEELLQAENEAAMNNQEEIAEEISGVNGGFIPHTIQTEVDRQALSDYETLVKNFYTIDANTMAGSDQLDVNKLLGKDMRVSKDSAGPQILIFHTHSQEGFADSVPGDSSTTIVGVGERLTEILTNTYGYQVLHHMGEYDVDTRDDAYSKALPALEQLLQDNPSIQVVIDLHRDQMPEETKLVMDLDGRPTARFMFFNGLSRTKKTGDISYLYNANQEDNLAFSFQMQLKATEYYPGLTRRIYLKGYRYNMHLCPKSLLVELGAQNNTVEEAMNACDPLAHILDMVLSGN